MKEIPLTRGLVALVDDEDFERLTRYSWCAEISKTCCYAIRKQWINKRKITIRMHREVAGLPAGSSKTIVDHINGNGIDNRRCNLRAATRSQNMLNRAHAPNVHGFIGVQSHKNCRSKPFSASFKFEGKAHHLGYFSCAEDAARARDAFARAHPAAEFVKYNFPT